MGPGLEKQQKHERTRKQTNYGMNNRVVLYRGCWLLRKASTTSHIPVFVSRLSRPHTGILGPAASQPASQPAS